MKQKVQVLYSPNPNFNPSRDLPLSCSSSNCPQFVPIESWLEGEQLMAKKPIAVILPITRELSTDKNYLDFVNICLRQTKDFELFRIYVYSRGISFDELKAINDLANLLDSINIIVESSEDEAIRKIDKHFAEFLDNAKYIEARIRYQRIFAPFLFIFAMTSFSLMLIGLLCAILALVRYFVPSLFNILSPQVTTILSFAISFLACSSGLLGITNVRSRVVLVGLTIGAFVALATLPLDWISLSAGVLLAIPTDYFRRIWLASLPIKLSNQVEQGWDLKRSSYDPWLVFGGELWPRDRRVFISYNGGSWKKKYDQDYKVKIREVLRKHNIYCFLDKQDIEVGISWRYKLEVDIRQSTLLLFFDYMQEINNEKVNNEVQKAELLTAIELRQRTGIPKIIIVTPADGKTHPAQYYRDQVQHIIGSQHFRIIPISLNDLDLLVRNIVNTELSLRSNIRNATPFGDLLFKTLIQSPLSIIAVILNYVVLWGTYIFIASLILIVLSILPFNLLNSGIVSIYSWLCIGYFLRAVIYIQSEARFSDETSDDSLTPSFAAIRNQLFTFPRVKLFLFIIVFCVLQLYQKDQTFIYYWIAFCWGMWSLDLSIHLGKFSISSRRYSQLGAI